MVSAVISRPIQVLDTILCAPFRHISDKVRKLAEAVFGYLVRIITFQLGEINRPGAASIIRFYQQFTSDPRDKLAYNPERLQQSKELLLKYGGVETFLTPEDGGAIVHCMHFRSADFMRRIGGELLYVEHDGRDDRPALKKSSEEAIKKFRIPVSKDGHAILPDAPRPNEENPRVMMLCHSPGRAACMGREEIAHYLLAGHDVVIWDPRGTAESTGTPSEGGYYLDAEAVYHHIIRQGYEANDVYVSGYCKGAAIAAHVKREFHDRGVNLIMSNPYTSMKEVVEGYGWFGWLGARYGLPAIQSIDSEITTRTTQDFFDNVAKLKNLPLSNGKFIFIHTDTDKMMPRGTVSRLIEAVHTAGPIHEILHVHKNPRENGHMTPPESDPQVQWRLFSIIRS